MPTTATKQSVISDDTLELISLEAKSARFKSADSFLRQAIKSWKREKLIRELDQQMEDIESGKEKVFKLNSLKDLR